MKEEKPDAYALGINEGPSGINKREEIKPTYEELQTRLDKALVTLQDAGRVLQKIPDLAIEPVLKRIDEALGRPSSRLEPGFLAREINKAVNREENTDTDRCKTCGRASPKHWEKPHSWDKPVPLASMTDSRDKCTFCDLPEEENRAHGEIAKGAEIYAGTDHKFKPTRQGHPR
ncbi:hypothetical protein LCGC14_0422430 [marine sediment metagenome]|uniref:Uncharacterized protein n=1 Tax=marine sediment metagenome TaxID=412755 RepID=A0A0F9VZX1_9ZZZZ